MPLKRNVGGEMQNVSQVIVGRAQVVRRSAGAAQVGKRKRRGGRAMPSFFFFFPAQTERPTERHPRQQAAAWKGPSIGSSSSGGGGKNTPPPFTANATPPSEGDPRICDPLPDPIRIFRHGNSDPSDLSWKKVI